ncbi:hypothetical protein CIPAW_01G287200, partial [Carya illinoinensis]
HCTRNNGNMNSDFFHEFKRQASLFLTEKIKTARLALSYVTPAELMTEEATIGNAWPPDTRTMRVISMAAFEVDDFWRITEILHKRFLKFDRKNWRLSYNALILLEYLLTHGPLSVAKEFQRDKDVIKEMASFQYVDERGFNWGLSVKNLSEKVLKLIESETLHKEERARAFKLTHRIERFGSFGHRSSSGDATLEDSSFKTYGRCNSNYNDHQRHEIGYLTSSKSFSIEEGTRRAKGTLKYINSVLRKRENDAESRPGIGDGYTIEDHPLCCNEDQTIVPLLSADE